MDEEDEENLERGSDELLADDNLRLPENANILVRVHAVRAWLARRREEAAQDVGTAALELQQSMQPSTEQARPLRRREQLLQQERVVQAQQAVAEAQARLGAYEEAQNILEDCIAHTNGERVLVEYYLMLENRMQSDPPVTALEEEEPQTQASWHAAMSDVQHRIEHIGASNEEEM